MIYLIIWMTVGFVVNMSVEKVLVWIGGEKAERDAKFMRDIKESLLNQSRTEIVAVYYILQIISAALFPLTLFWLFVGVVLSITGIVVDPFGRSELPPKDYDVDSSYLVDKVVRKASSHLSTNDMTKELRPIVEGVFKVVSQNPEFPLISRQKREFVLVECSIRTIALQAMKARNSARVAKTDLRKQELYGQAIIYDGLVQALEKIL